MFILGTIFRVIKVRHFFRAQTLINWIEAHDVQHTSNESDMELLNPKEQLVLAAWKSCAIVGAIENAINAFQELSRTLLNC